MERHHHHSQKLLYLPSHQASLKYFGSTLVKTAPLLLCPCPFSFHTRWACLISARPVQYVAGAGACLFAALAWDWPRYACLIAAMFAGALFGALSGVLKAYCNVERGHLRHHAQLDRSLRRKHAADQRKGILKPLHPKRSQLQLHALMPTLGLDKLFSNNKYVTIAIPLAVFDCRAHMDHPQQDQSWAELKATGYNKDAARYCGMKEKKYHPPR